KLPLPANARVANWDDYDSSSEEPEQKASFAVRTPSHWSQASYAPTPAQRWSKTPSPCATPEISPAPAPIRAAACAAASSRPAVDRSFEAFAGMPDLAPFVPGVIPMYVTVPLAVAHCCPHCGKHLALPPESQDAPA
ncbi:unnamed protein product, partial [Polarella glacialis]